MDEWNTRPSLIISGKCSFWGIITENHQLVRCGNYSDLREWQSRSPFLGIVSDQAVLVVDLPADFVGQPGGVAGDLSHRGDDPQGPAGGADQADDPHVVHELVVVVIKKGDIP